MITFPNAKINLGLRITAKLENGFHAIESGLYPIPWCDILEVVPASKKSLETTGITIPGKPEDDIVSKAYRLLKKDFQLPELAVHLQKQIPIGAGLGGGSADAAFMLKLLNHEFQLFLEDNILEDYAAELGSDCPFFVKNTPALATGTGVDLDPLILDLSNTYLFLINPNIHISTKEAYSGVVPKENDVDLKELLETSDFDLWTKHLVNDFEISLFPKYPVLKELKELLYDKGAQYAAMSGSGSTMFGLFKTDPSHIEVKSPDWIMKSFKL